MALADERISLGPQTMAHQLARVVLLEQLFRADQDPGRRAVPPIAVRRRLDPWAIRSQSSAPPSRRPRRRCATAPRRGGSAPTLERPPKPEFGDYSTNAAMLLAPALGEQPRGTAEKLAEELGRSLEGSLEKVEVAGPGFLNLFLADAWYRRAAAELASQGERLGRPAGADEVTERINVEFVSANPTGPVTAAGGRGAALGDSIARVLEFAGHPVTREYYINDRGGQIDRFAASIAARMKGEPLPGGRLRGRLRRGARARASSRRASTRTTSTPSARRGIALMVERGRGDAPPLRRRLRRLVLGALAARVRRRRAGPRPGAGGRPRLRERGRDLAADHQLRRRQGPRPDPLGRRVRPTSSPTSPTTATSSSAGSDRLIDVLGADHHGYVERLRAALAALGYDPDALEVAIMQLVHVVEGGERAQMSKRSGEFVTLDELIDDIGADAARFFMLQRSHDTTVDLDLELARKTSNENPVYYVQYAHARIASILRKAEEEAGTARRAGGDDFAALPVEPTERALIKRLCELPDEVAETAARRAPHRLCAYAMEVARDFHAFYRDCQVVGAEGEGVEEARLGLCLLTKRTIARTLGLLGISAPERM